MNKKTDDAELLTVALPSTLTIDTVEQFVSEISGKLVNQARVIADASGLTLITTPGLQALLSLHQTLHLEGSALAVSHFSPEIIRVFEQAGLHALATQWADNHSPAFETEALHG